MGMSGGGGGSSGKVEYPSYMQSVHTMWLDAADTDVIEASITDLMNAALGASPLGDATAYDPTTVLATAETSVSALTGLSLATLISDIMTNFTTVAAKADTIAPVSSTAAIILEEAEVLSDVLDNEIATKVLPKFQRGMQDINAVQLSSFVIGEALIYAEKTRQVAKITGDLVLKNNSDRTTFISQLIDAENKSIAHRVDFYRVISHMATEFARIQIVAQKEKNDFSISLDERHALWDLKVYQYGCNVMASITGAAATVNSSGNTIGTALGGALSGAAGGAMVGSSIPGGTIPGGTIPGAVIGGIAGLLGSL